MSCQVMIVPLQADSWLQSKGIDPYYSLFPDRCNVLVAGRLLLSLYIYASIQIMSLLNIL